MVAYSSSKRLAGESENVGRQAGKWTDSVPQENRYGSGSP
jgi:hypothetical protein